MVYSEKDLAKLILKLQVEGAENINLVTPTHFLPQILKALIFAYAEGLDIPIVYNTSGFEKEEIIEELEGIVDIYLPDLKYLSSETSQCYSRAPDYPKFATKAIKEMYRQTCSSGTQDFTQKGLIIRHLVIPSYIEETFKVLSWIKDNTPQAALSLMFQYQPYFKAQKFPEINRKLTPKEYRQVTDFLESLGINGWVQEFDSKENLAGIYFSPLV